MIEDSLFYTIIDFCNDFPWQFVAGKKQSRQLWPLKISPYPLKTAVNQGCNVNGMELKIETETFGFEPKTRPIDLE